MTFGRSTWKFALAAGVAAICTYFTLPGVIGKDIG